MTSAATRTPNPPPPPATRLSPGRSLARPPPSLRCTRRCSGGGRTPCATGVAALENYRAFARLHVSLFPYLYSYAKVAADTGVPIIRPLVLMNQRDPNTYWLENAYLFGNELLVAPILVGNSKERDIYLPRGG